MALSCYLIIQSQGKKEIGERIFLLKSRGHFLYLFELSEAFDSFSLSLLNVFCFNFHDDTLLPSPFLASSFQLSLEIFDFGSIDSPTVFSPLSHTPIFSLAISPATVTSPGLPTLRMAKSVSLSSPFTYPVVYWPCPLELNLHSSPFLNPTIQ